MLYCGSYQFDLARPLVMGILNVTPDSFSDGGMHYQREAAIVRARQMFEEGADIVDIGGESTRPGAFPVDADEEIKRVLPVIEALHGMPVSVDTFKPEVMQAATGAGACMINDVNALMHEDAMEVAAKNQVAVCLMHKQGDPQTMQTNPEYKNVVNDVMSFLQGRIAAAEAAGIHRNRLVVDPGFGFGKTFQHNLELLQNLDQFKKLHLPILAGLSRKSMLGELTGQDAQHRMPASIAAALIAAQKGAYILRVHDVKETVDALKIWNAIKKGTT
jgi:dihydropteroate synthase